MNNHNDNNMPNVVEFNDEPAGPFDKAQDPIDFTSRSNQSAINIETKRSLVEAQQIAMKRKYDSDIVVNKDAQI